MDKDKEIKTDKSLNKRKDKGFHVVSPPFIKDLEGGDHSFGIINNIIIIIPLIINFILHYYIIVGGLNDDLSCKYENS